MSFAPGPLLEGVPAARHKTARQRGESGLSCAYCLEACVLPDTKRPRRHRFLPGAEQSPVPPPEIFDSDRLATCSRCMQSWHMMCGSRELQCIMKNWAEQRRDVSSPPIYKCPTCRAVLTGEKREARVKLTPPRRKASLESKFREARRDLEHEEKFIERVRRDIQENAELDNSGVRSMLSYVERDLAEARARLALLGEQLKARRQARMQGVSIPPTRTHDVPPAAPAEQPCVPCEP
jgi:hypothetical protein